MDKAVATVLQTPRVIIEATADGWSCTIRTPGLMILGYGFVRHDESANAKGDCVNRAFSQLA